MGAYLNPGNNGYREILQSEYVDKTGLIALINHTLGTREKLSCISRPRRFGKSYAAKMLCAYYDCSCDSRELCHDSRRAVRVLLFRQPAVPVPVRSAVGTRGGSHRHSPEQLCVPALFRHAYEFPALLLRRWRVGEPLYPIAGDRREIWVAWRIQDSLFDTVRHHDDSVLHAGSLEKGPWQKRWGNGTGDESADGKELPTNN